MILGRKFLTPVSGVALRAVIYARFSSDNQRDASIDDQIRLCREACARQAWQVEQCDVDRALSGSSDSRPGYQTLRERIRRREFDVLVAESLDRLSRDQEHTASLYKQCQFAEIQIFTLAEGWITELHVGLKGTMNALYLVDLAEKTRRGLRGRVESGASAGGLSYGYDVTNSDGEERGGRTINPVQAAIVRRIFERYSDGQSPRRIAHALNSDGILGPRSAGWTQSTINGNRKRGTGILNNELYAGFLVWNRLRYVKDPNTGKRRSRINASDEILAKAVPHLRIVSDDLWDAVRKRQVELDGKKEAVDDGSGFWSKQRPKYLFSGLVRCGACDGGASMISATHLGCSAARNKGEAACTNRRTIKRTMVEAEVLGALRTRLMAPDIYRSFVAGFTQEWNKEQGARDAEQTGKRDELKRVNRKIGNLVDAIAENGSSAALQTRLKEQEGRKLALEGELAVAEAPAPRLMPNLAELYRAKVESLQDALEADDADAARARIRSLVEEIRLVPAPTDPNAPLTIEVRGQLAAMLALGSGEDDKASEAFASQLKMVAGAGFEPAAFRL